MRRPVLLALLLAAAPVRAETTAITYGQMLTGSLAAAAGEQDVFTFTAPESGKVLVRVVRTAGDPPVGFALVRVGIQTMGTVSNAGVAATLPETTVIQGNDYEIRIPATPTGAGYTGQSYRVLLQERTAPVGATALGVGGTATGAIDHPGEMDFYTVVGHTGDEVLVTVTRTSGALDPSGLLLFPGGSCTPAYAGLDASNNPTVQTACMYPSSRTFGIAVEDVDDAGTASIDPIETGGYEITVACVSAFCPTTTTTTTTTLAAPSTTTTTVAGSTTTTTTLPPVVEQRVQGLTLVLKDKPGKPQKRAVAIVLADDGLTLGGGNGSGDDPRTAGATLRLRSTAAGFDDTYALRGVRWKTIGPDGASKGYRYADTARAGGPVTSGRVKPTRIALVAKGSGLGIGLATAPAPVDVVLTMGGVRYCARFGGSVTTKGVTKLTAKNAPAPAVCP